MVARLPRLEVLTLLDVVRRCLPGFPNLDSLFPFGC